MIKFDKQNEDFYAVDTPLMVVGTMLIILGLSLMNACGLGTDHSLMSMQDRLNAERAFINTFLAGSVSSLICFVVKRHIVGINSKVARYDVKSLCNGFLTGIAAVSGGCHTYKPWAAAVIGIIASVLYMFMCLIFKKIKFDDPMENF
jgi:ammonia channel protein AmtB